MQTNEQGGSVTTIQGLVAVLDALGTKLLSASEAIEFVRLRDSILTFTETIAETSLKGLDMARLGRFTFNDTVIYTYAPAAGLTLGEVERFSHVLRVFETQAIIQGTPFRGAVSLGEFYVGDERTVLGPAISDAASWYEAADWAGIHATPHASLTIEALLARAPAGSTLNHVLLDYDVPLKSDKAAARLKAVNWPKGFYVQGLRPAGEGTTKGLVLSALTTRRISKGTEAKYFKAMRFFDYVNSTQDLDSRWGAVPSPAPPGTT